MSDTGTGIGTGIDAEAQRHLFEAFSRADASTAREQGGTGPARAISRRLARKMGGRWAGDGRAMGGDITIGSAPRQGSRFVPRFRAGRVADGALPRDAAATRAAIEQGPGPGG